MSENQGEWKKIKASELRSGPIQHETLPPELLKEIKHLYDHVGKYITPTLEQWELGFMRDLHVEREVALWKRILTALTDYRKQHLGGKQLRDRDAEQLVGAMSAISMGVTDAASLKLPKRTAARLVECYLNAQPN